MGGRTSLWQAPCACSHALGAPEFSTAQWHERPDILLEEADQFLKPEIPTLIRALFSSLPRSQNKWGWPSHQAGCSLGWGGGRVESQQRELSTLWREYCSTLFKPWNWRAGVWGACCSFPQKEEILSAFMSLWRFKHFQCPVLAKYGENKARKSVEEEKSQGLKKLGKISVRS